MRSPTAALHSVLRVLTFAALAFAATPAVLAQPAAATGAPRASAPPPVALLPGDKDPRGASPSGPVTIGVYLYSVQDLDFSKHTFHPTFEVWFRWRGDAFDPLANLHVVGARATTVTLEDRRRLADGENYVVARVDAVINETFDTGAFPFDRHRLEIEIESPFEDDYVVFEVDGKASMLDPDAFSPWPVQSSCASIASGIDAFGLTSASAYSRRSAEVVPGAYGCCCRQPIGFIVCVLLCCWATDSRNLLAARRRCCRGTTPPSHGRHQQLTGPVTALVTSR